MEERDEYEGQGGSYTVDPATGKRTRIEEPTKPHPQGGARNADGELLDQPAPAPQDEPAASRRRTRRSE